MATSDTKVRIILECSCPELKSNKNSYAHKSDFSKESKVDFDSGYERLKIILLFASSFNSLIYRT